MLEECQALLHNFSLQAQSLDTWQWQPDVAKGYSVLDAYQLLTSQEFEPMMTIEDLIWHKRVPLKVSILAWRLLRDRLPTKANLAARGIITPAALPCVTDCGGVESAQHLFLSCSMFGSLWSSVRSWIGFTAVDHQNLPDHFLQFTHSLGDLRERRSFLQLIWLACVWIIWNERNNRLFRNTAKSLPQLLDKVKLHSYWWLKATR
ncbi:heat-shock protein, partial [Trifolium medium]|nr:heat-shock protein [Trifolium medium]